MLRGKFTAQPEDRHQSARALGGLCVMHPTARRHRVDQNENGRWQKPHASYCGESGYANDQY